MNVTPVKPTKSQWLNDHYRPAMAYLYMAICAFDFIIFPLIMQMASIYTPIAYTQWKPLTLSGGGIFHLSFGAILGVSSWGRTKEKLGGVVPGHTVANTTNK